jgi:hypothetical protein
VAPVVVSLSTLPPRSDYLALTIESLLSQSRRPDAIYVNVPYSARRAPGPIDVPACLPALQGRARHLHVIRTEDYGPGTKLLPAVERVTDPEGIIITVDDDMIYSPKLVETLVAASALHKNWAVGFAGWNVAKDGGFDRARSPFVDVLQGFAGAAYRRRFFRDDFLDAHRRHPLCFYVDDVWISGYLAEHGHSRFLLRPKLGPRHTPNTAINALRTEPEKVEYNRTCACCWNFKQGRRTVAKGTFGLPRIRTNYAVRRNW